MFRSLFYRHLLVTFQSGDFGGRLKDMRDEGAEFGGADGLVHVAVEQPEEELDALLAGATHCIPRYFLERLKGGIGLDFKMGYSIGLFLECIQRKSAGTILHGKLFVPFAHPSWSSPSEPSHLRSTEPTDRSRVQSAPKDIDL